MMDKKFILNQESKWVINYLTAKDTDYEIELSTLEEDIFGTECVDTNMNVDDLYDWLQNTDLFNITEMGDPLEDEPTYDIKIEDEDGNYMSIGPMVMSYTEYFSQYIMFAE